MYLRRSFLIYGDFLYKTSMLWWIKYSLIKLQTSPLGVQIYLTYARVESNVDLLRPKQWEKPHSTTN